VANKKVTLLRYCKTESGWRRFPVVIGKTGKVRPDAVLANGQERIYPDGYYCIRTYLGDKPQYTNVGTDQRKRFRSSSERRSCSRHGILRRWPASRS